MSDESLAVAILREIRDEVKETNVRLDRTREEIKAEIQQTNLRLDQTNVRLDKVEETLRDLAAQQLMLTRYVKNVVDRHEQSIDDLRERVTRLEAQRK